MCTKQKLNEMRVKTYLRAKRLENVAECFLAGGYSILSLLILLWCGKMFTPTYPISEAFLHLCVYAVIAAIAGVLCLCISLFLYLLCKHRYPNIEKLEKSLKREHLI